MDMPIGMNLNDWEHLRAGGRIDVHGRRVPLGSADSSAIVDRERGLLPDGRIALFTAGARKLRIDGRLYDVWNDLVDEATSATVLCSWEDFCGRCELCRLTTAPAGGAAVVTSYRETGRRRRAHA